jgi:SAM-dependent methyltransferase
MMRRTMHHGEEPLLESAPLAWQLAPQLCHKDPVTGIDCSWYHGIWQVLRLTGLASSAAQRSAFYDHWIQASCAGSQQPRILISGTADYAMLALILASFEDRGARPAITVLDICETPLRANHWYAERKGCVIETVCSDILEYRAPKPFDIVCTDGFLSRFPSRRRPALVAKWRDLLRQGGRVISTNRLHPDAKEEMIRFSPSRAQAFRDSVRDAVTEKQHAIGIDPQALIRLAELYALRHDTYPVGSPDEVQRLFEQAGFRMDALVETSRAGRQQDGTNNPSDRKKTVVQLQFAASRL